MEAGEPHNPAASVFVGGGRSAKKQTPTCCWLVACLQRMYDAKSGRTRHVHVHAHAQCSAASWPGQAKQSMEEKSCSQCRPFAFLQFSSFAPTIEVDSARCVLGLWQADPIWMIDCSARGHAALACRAEPACMSKMQVYKPFVCLSTLFVVRGFYNHY